jgi:hypothetical protein
MGIVKFYPSWKSKKSSLYTIHPHIIPKQNYRYFCIMGITIKNDKTFDVQK